MTDLEFNKVHVGDCLEILPEIRDGAFDVILTDPPWPGCSVKFDGVGDERELFREAAYHLDRIAPRIIVMLSCKTDPGFLSCIKTPFMRLVIGRHIPAPRHGPILDDFEAAYVYSRKNYLPPGSRVMPGIALARFNVLNRRPGFREDTGHPCPRPPEFVEFLLKWYTRPGSTILDPFAGAGTTVISAIRTGRRAVGIEINPEYAVNANQLIGELFTEPLFTTERKGGRHVMPVN